MERKTKCRDMERKTKRRDMEWTTERRDMERITKRRDMERKTKRRNIEWKTKQQDMDRITKHRDMERKTKHWDMERIAECRDMERKTECWDMERIAEFRDMERKTKRWDMERIAECRDMERKTKRWDMERIAECRDMERKTERRNMERKTKRRDMERKTKLKIASTYVNFQLSVNEDVIDEVTDSEDDSSSGCLDNSAVAEDSGKEQQLVVRVKGGKLKRTKNKRLLHSASKLAKLIRVKDTNQNEKPVLNTTQEMFLLPSGRRTNARNQEQDPQNDDNPDPDTPTNGEIVWPNADFGGEHGPEFQPAESWEDEPRLSYICHPNLQPPLDQ
ncbi:uncharacterized protein [Palaemon carinicauda]|uniref:uncharacterized protein n=1 Tax=Palaemon carinicauda TaxID=392227 RepID=UPI0035B5CCEC